MSNRQNRKSNAKKKSREKAERKRRATLENPPTTLSALDKLMLTPASVLGNDDPGASLQKFVAAMHSDPFPVYLIDEVVGFTREQFANYKSDQYSDYLNLFAPFHMMEHVVFDYQTDAKDVLGMMQQTTMVQCLSKDAFLARASYNHVFRQYTDSDWWVCSLTGVSSWTKTNVIGAAPIFYTVRINPEGYIIPGSAIATPSDGSQRTPEQLEHHVEFMVDAINCTFAALGFLAAHNFKPVVMKERQHTRNEKKYIEATRRKLPEYERKVFNLWVNRDKTRVVDDGEAESRPGTRQRYHQRRGHFGIRGKNKLKVWIRGCWAGDKRLGTVHKRTKVRLG